MRKSGVLRARLCAVTEGASAKNPWFRQDGHHGTCVMLRNCAARMLDRWVSVWGSSLVPSLGNYQDLTCAYFNLTSVNLFMVAPCDQYIVVYYSCMHSTGHIWACNVIVKDFSTIIINVIPSPWSRHGSSHEDLTMHANTHVHTHVYFVDILGRNSGQDGL
jgi:hypothetical protein